MGGPTCVCMASSHIREVSVCVCVCLDGGVLRACAWLPVIYVKLVCVCVCVCYVRVKCFACIL